MSKIIKQCSCGRKYDLFSFLSLPIPGNGKSISYIEYEGELCIDIWRNCSCGSTIAIFPEECIDF